MKKLFVLILIVFVGLTFAGCTSARNLSSVNTAFSSVYFVVDCEQNLKEATDSEKEVIKSKIELLGKDYIKEIKIRYNANLNNLFLADKVNSSQKTLYQNHLTSSSSWKENKFVIEFKFYSNFASKMFIQSGEYLKVENKESLLAITTIESFKGSFSNTPNNLTDLGLENYFNSGIEVVFEEINGGQKTLKAPNYYYIFLSENPKLHSANANQTVELGEKTLFCFSSLKDYSEIEFQFYVVQPNVFVYYLLALTITFVFVAIYLVVIYFKKPKKLRGFNGNESQIS